MNQTKGRYIELDLIRVVCCIAVLLYHLGILAGGFFAVCTFFVISAYLGVRSSFRQERFNIFKYWASRLQRVYVPLLAVVLITVLAVSLLPQIRWLNLKPETTSVLLGYNNFWQISASQDYFARHGESPFIHFWYIAILLQFEIIFPVVFAVLKFIGEKISRAIACLLPLAASAASFYYFYQLLREGRITEAYYHSMARAFAPFLGMVVGFAEQYLGSLVPRPMRRSTAASWTVFAVYLAAFAYINIALDNSFEYLAWAFLAVTFISARLVSYACIDRPTNHGRAAEHKVFSFIADSSYEIYLVQYPVIFILGELFSEKTDSMLLTAGTIAGTLITAFLLHYGLHFRKGRKPAGLKIAMLIAILLVAGAGGYYFSVAEDHTQELAELEQRLEENSLEMEARQKAIEQQSSSEENRWEELLSSIDKEEETIKQAVLELPVVAIGDSVMLGALNDLMKMFPNGWFDAQKSRTAWVLPGILSKLKNSGLLGEVIVVNFGANGDSPMEVKERAMNIMEGSSVFWLTNTNPRTQYSNEALAELAKEYSNLTVIDWKAISSGHPEYFGADGIHLTGEGRKAYCEAIKNAVSEHYLEQWREKKAEAEQEYERYRSQMVSFYGNDLLINAYELLDAAFSHAGFKTYRELDVQVLKEDLERAAGAGLLADRIVLALDGSAELTQEELKQIASAAGERKLYLAVPGSIDEVAEDGSTKQILAWTPEGGEMLMADELHLTPEANRAFAAAVSGLLNAE